VLGKEWEESEVVVNDVRVRDPTRLLALDDCDTECFLPDEPGFNCVEDEQEFLVHRLFSVSNILRNLSFVPGNDLELGKSAQLLLILGKLLLLKHEHEAREERERMRRKHAAANLEPEEPAGEDGSNE
jgi:AT-rich interactive domain-containing protein 1